MRVEIKCPICGSKCNKILEKTLLINKDILFRCINCKCLIAIRIFKTKEDKLWG